MTDVLTSLSEKHTAGFLLVLARIGPLFLLAPLFGLRAVPLRARLIVALALAVGIAPIAMGDAELPTAVAPFAELMIKEVLVGLAFAFAVGSVIWAVQVAGNFIDLFLGFSFGGLVDPLSGFNASVISNFYSMMGVGVFVAIGGDAIVIQGMARTYDLIPLVDAPSVGVLLTTVDTAFVSIFRSALEVVAPILIAVTLTDAAFGVLTKVVPQLNVISVGFPAKIAVGLVVLVASLPFLGGYLADSLDQSMRDALNALGG